MIFLKLVRHPNLNLYLGTGILGAKWKVEYQHVGFGDLWMSSKGTQVDFHPSFFNVHRGDGDKTFTRELRRPGKSLNEKHVANTLSTDKNGGLIHPERFFLKYLAGRATKTTRRKIVFVPTSLLLLLSHRNMKTLASFPVETPHTCRSAPWTYRR